MSQNFVEAQHAKHCHGELPCDAHHIEASTGIFSWLDKTWKTAAFCATRIALEDALAFVPGSTGHGNNAQTVYLSE